MSAVLTPEERLARVDQAVEELKQGFVQAVEHLSETDEVDSAFSERLREIGKRLQKLPGEVEPSDFDPEPLHEFHIAMHKIRDLMQSLDEDEDRLDTLDALLVEIERIRHVIRDAIDEHVTGIHTDTGLVVRDLERWLPGTSRVELARLLNVHPRTLSRWAEKSGTPPRRLQLVAQLVAILRHSWTEEGVIAWFGRANRDLDARKPIAVLDDPAYERTLLMAARATRSQYAT